ncbi:GNAT family N-acetyltransferase [Microbacteriaceae bacterium VKM Ac-2855]|nr:GNAT family N-acetyltransferase [Microbacteriaceae bacterium VKM Ac-2855]
MLALSDDYHLGIYEPENFHRMDVADLEGEHVRVFVARDETDRSALGMAALVLGPDEFGELKRMFVHDGARGRGVARRLLTAVEAYARVAGARILRLETGAPQVEAVGLYRATGFVDIDRFGPYVLDPTSLCMAKPLV